MTIEQTVDIPADHRLTINVPYEIPAGKAILTFTAAEAEPEYGTEAASTGGEWVNPLKGLAKRLGSTLTVERFLEMQHEEVERENENDRRLWGNQ